MTTITIINNLDKYNFNSHKRTTAHFNVWNDDGSVLYRNISLWGNQKQHALKSSQPTIFQTKNTSSNTRKLVKKDGNGYERNLSRKTVLIGTYLQNEH